MSEEGDNVQHLGPRIAHTLTGVNLTHRSNEALTGSADLTGDTKTDVINKALQLYYKVQLAQSHGGGTWMQPAAGEPITKTLWS